MIDILKMTKLDFFTLKDSSTVVFLLSPFAILLVLFNGVSSMLLYFGSLWLVICVCIYISFSQERNCLKRLYSSLPLLPKNIVAGRYLFIFLCFAFYTTTTFSLHSGFNFLSHAPINLEETLLNIVLSFLLFSISVGILLPLCFKMGSSKGKFIAIFAFYAILVAMSFLKSTTLFTSVLTYLLAKEGLLITCSIIGGGFLYYLSYSISVAIYRKK